MGTNNGHDFWIIFNPDLSFRRAVSHDLLLMVVLVPMMPIFPLRVVLSPSSTLGEIMSITCTSPTISETAVKATLDAVWQAITMVLAPFFMRNFVNCLE